jgi:hypothetical protein
MSATNDRVSSRRDRRLPARERSGSLALGDRNDIGVLRAIVNSRIAARGLGTRGPGEVPG